MRRDSIKLPADQCALGGFECSFHRKFSTRM